VDVYGSLSIVFSCFLFKKNKRMFRFLAADKRSTKPTTKRRRGADKGKKENTERGSQAPVATEGRHRVQQEARRAADSTTDGAPQIEPN
jgi:hypothetical protein